MSNLTEIIKLFSCFLYLFSSSLSSSPSPCSSCACPHNSFCPLVFSFFLSFFVLVGFPLFFRYQSRKCIFFPLSSLLLYSLFLRLGPTLAYTSTPSYVAVSLPYRGSPSTSMLVIVPTSASSSALSGLRSLLAARLLDQLLLAPASSGTVNLALPKFEISGSSQSLKALLISLGMTNAFNPMTADFSNMLTQQNKLFVSDVVHKAFFKVRPIVTSCYCFCFILLSYFALLTPNRHTRSRIKQYPGERFKGVTADKELERKKDQKSNTETQSVFQFRARMQKENRPAHMPCISFISIQSSIPDLCFPPLIIHSVFRMFVPLCLLLLSSLCSPCRCLKTARKQLQPLL